MFYVYILECRDKTLYTGYTVDINERVKTHSDGLGAKYTRGRLPVKLVYLEVLETKGEAMSREYKIKALSRRKKLELIKTYDKNL